MSLGRTSLQRNRSRSPRPFLPPSHYAIAGGFPLPTPKPAPDASNLPPGNNFIPISYNSDSSDSSFEYKPAKDSPDPSMRTKRASQIGNLEAHLLPSLRDTIDRMTKPPSVSTSHLEKPKSMERSLSPRPDYAGARSQLQRPQIPSPNSPKVCSTPEPSTPKQKPATAATKTPLKSALRAPTPKLFSPKQEVIETASPASTGGALRSVKSLLRRKSSATALESVPNRSMFKENKPNDEPPQHHRRTRSRTDPGTSVTTQNIYNVPTTPQLGSNRGNTLDTGFLSHIPRVAPLKTSLSSKPADDSDFEYRYDLEGRGRRKLVVTNAEVIASSSSEESNSIRRRLALSRQMNAAIGEDVRPIGLGLAPGTMDVLPAFHQDERYEDDDQSVYEDNDDSRLSFDNNENSFRQPIQDHSLAMDDSEAARRKRRAALVGLVSGLEKMGASSRVNDWNGDDESYHGEEGLAVSRSGGDIRPQDACSDSGSEYNVPEQPMSKVSISREEVMSRGGIGRDLPLQFTRELQQSSTSNSFRMSRSLSRQQQERETPLVPIPGRQTSSPRSHLRANYSTSSRDSQNYEAVKLAQHSRAAAARERQAFGLPPSESDGVYGDSLPQADSILSTVDSSGRWQEDEEELSVAAEALFRKITGTRFPAEAPTRALHADNELPPTPSPASDFNRRRQHARTPVYAKSAHPAPPPGTWGATLAPSIYETLVEQHGELEMQRQEVIWELCQSEASFVDRLSSVVHLFILPLRIQDSKDWISGVPSDIAKLFDWLEDIVNLHTQILARLHSVQSEQMPLVRSIAGDLRVFVPRLEVYQPYLVRFPAIVRQLGQLSRDRTSDFGEFVRLQNSDPSAKGTLQNLLSEPSERLATYLNLFKRLLDATPKTHQDFVATLSLMRSTDLAVNVMSEVKTREEEYDFMKEISERVVGLPQSFPLAKRGRRLLCQGLLYQVKLQDDSASAQFKSRLPRRNHRAPTESPNLIRSNRLVDAINEWEVNRTRSGSTASTGTGLSSGSYRANSSSDSSAFPPTPRNPTSGSAYQQESLSDFASQFAQPSLDQVFKPSLHSPATRASPRLIRAFVFTDLLMLATKTKSDGGSEESKLLDLIAFYQIVDLTQISHESNGMIALLATPSSIDDAEPPLIALDVLPFDVNLQSVSSSLLDVVYFSVPKDQELEQDTTSPSSWLTAFRKSLQFSLRSISNPKNATVTSNLELELESDLEHLLDTRETMHSILGSGLPMPKSPSLQIKENDKKRLEREERGWWTLQFQQVLREFQRQETACDCGNQQCI